MVQFTYILMSQKDFLQNEVLEEILRERANYYHSQNKPVDFWVTISPRFINFNNLLNKIKQTNFYNLKKKDLVVSGFNNLFLVAIVSTNKDFIKWVELRYGYFETLENDKIQISNLSSKSQLVSDGIVGFINSTNVDVNLFNSLFRSYPTNIHPDFLVKKFVTLLSSLESRTNSNLL